VQVVYVVLGVLCVSLGIAGIFLPVLPTTPFILLASYCFVRGSPALDARLRRSAFFGRLIDDWERHRALRRRTKITAFVGMGIGVTASILAAWPSVPIIATALALSAWGAIYVARIPTRPD
jgi:uncharacterized membrane protein YbaN (DUF454 family)